MDETLLKLRILARAESTLIRASARRAAQRARYFGLALGLVLLTVIMVNVAAFHYLSEFRSSAEAALIVAGVNALLAIIVAILGLRVRPSTEEDMVREVRQLALQELSTDLDVVKEDLAQVTENVRQIRSGMNSAMGMVRSAPGIGPLRPALKLITSMLQK